MVVDHADARHRAIRRWIGAFERSSDLRDACDPAGRRVLDYACGDGRFSVELARRGASHVTGFDVAATRIDAARRRATDLGLDDRTTFVVADAHDTGLPAASFDLVVGGDILHRLHLTAAAVELRRLLAPGGTALFVEPLAGNPLRRLGRRLTGSVRREDEHPLTPADWQLLDACFPRFEHHERELLGVRLLPFDLPLPRSAQERVAGLLGRLDDRLLARFPAAGRWARRTLLVLGA